MRAVERHWIIKQIDSLLFNHTLDKEVRTTLEEIKTIMRAEEILYKSKGWRGKNGHKKS